MAKKPAAALDAAGLWQHALRLLSGRGYSLAELRDRLARRAAAADDVPDVLARLKEYGYLNDPQLARSYAAARLENQGLGKARVVRDLRARRVAPAVAEKAAAEVYTGTDELALIEAYLGRKYRGKALETFLADPKNLASAYRRLRTAGFSGGNAIRVLKRFAREAELLDSIEEQDQS